MSKPDPLQSFADSVQPRIHGIHIGDGLRRPVALRNRRRPGPDTVVDIFPIDIFRPHRRFATQHQLLLLRRQIGGLAA